MKTMITSWGKALSERPRAAPPSQLVLTLALAVAMTALSIVLGSGVGSAHAAETSSTTGHAWAWGWNEDGQLGDGYTADRRTIVPVKNLSIVTDVEAGSEHSLAASTMPLDTTLPINYKYCKVGEAVCAGTEGIDEIFGTAYQDNIRADSGEDQIYAKQGRDKVYAGDGRDVINTGGRDGDSDYVNCGAGRDKVYREASRDTVENCEVEIDY